MAYYKRFETYPAKKQLKRVDSILTAALKRKGLDKKIERYRFVLQWPAIVGRDLAPHCKPRLIKNGKLFVEVPDSSWAQELSFNRSPILQRLIPHLAPGDEVREIQFMVKGQ